METALSGSSIYEEHQRSRVLVTVMILVLVIVAGGLLGVAGLRQQPEFAFSFVIAFATALVVTWGFGKLTAAVYPTELYFGYPIWHRKVPLSKVEVGEIVPIPFWYGIGLHYVGGMWVYNARLGRGLMISIDGRRYLIGSDHPEQLQAALLQAAPRRKSV